MKTIIEMINQAAKLKNGPLDDEDLMKLDKELNELPWYGSLAQTDQKLFGEMSECLKN